ncbi:YheC/YheD family protein [Paludifilum halophilum]|uniref:ATP-grasp domain-containing protein n=1 Tax=Paludifilum halophilum TaxID=1642702 RepID=A0A235B6U4_9BACL|nr:YheC/YheD family protein [Paludifilum halophilum]OYD07952.1 hypothetical protein CHM34_07460 [Paludifilum halophilum]
MRRYRQIASKALKTKVMLENPILAPYIPFTTWYSEASLKRMLSSYPTVFVKPDKGGGGAGIIRVRRVTERGYQVNFHRTGRMVDAEHLHAVISRLQRIDKRYLIQQGIDLARINGRPVDIRVLLQKPGRRWIVSGMIAKVAARGQFVTNHCKGGQPISVERALSLSGNTGNPLPSDRTEELEKMALLTAWVLDSRFPGLRELGIDVGADQEGKLWIFEVNTRPQFQMFRKTERKKEYRKILNHHRRLVR